MSFSLQVAGFGARASKALQDTRKGVTIKLFGAVIRDTPVDEGTARANWQLTEGAPATGTVDTKAKGKRGLTVQEAQQVAATSGDNDLYLTNNLHYIGRLENGSSKQQPEGMVRKNLIRFAKNIRANL